MSKMDREIEDALEGINDAPPIASWTPNLKLGNHPELALVGYRLKNTLKAGRVIEADFRVLKSDVHKEGEIVGWSWFIDGKGWGGTYAKSRNQMFTTSMGECIGDDRTVREIGKDLFQGKGLGIVIACQVTLAVKAGVVQKRADGTDITNAEWRPISQSAEDVLATIKEFGLANVAEPAAEPAAAETAPTPSEPPARSGRFAGARR